jgi:hypothetical protein
VVSIDKNGILRVSPTIVSPNLMESQFPKEFKFDLTVENYLGIKKMWEITVDSRKVMENKDTLG